MAKKKTVISFQGVVNDMIEVESKAYGKHYRKPRGSVKPISINSSLQKSVELNSLVNPLAKAIKDALDPFRTDFKDGTMWSRLLSLLKKQLHQHPTLDLSVLEQFDLVKKNPLARNYKAQSSIVVLDDEPTAIEAEVTSHAIRNIETARVTQYQQKLIGIFLTADLKSTTMVDEKMMKIKTAKPDDFEKQNWRLSLPQVQKVKWHLPAGTRYVLLAVRFTPYNGTLALRRKATGMGIMKTLAIQ